MSLRPFVALAVAILALTGCTSSTSSDNAAASPGATPEATAPAAEGTPAAGGTPRATPSDEPQTSPGSSQGGAGFPVALCEMTSDRWATVVDTSLPAESQDDALRDGISLLEDRLSQWRSAAAGDPAAASAVELAATVSQDWRRALSALDEGDPQSADAALASSQATIDELDAALQALGSRGCE